MDPIHKLLHLQPRVKAIQQSVAGGGSSVTQVRASSCTETIPRTVSRIVSRIVSNIIEDRIEDRIDDRIEDRTEVRTSGSSAVRIGERWRKIGGGGKPLPDPPSH